MTDPLDFSSWENQAQEAQRRKAHGLNLRFFSETVPNAPKSAEAGRPIYDIVDFCGVNVPGSRDEFIQKMNAEGIRLYGPQYEMWKKTQEQPVEGTPISTVPFLNIAQVREFQAVNVMTLEQLANLSDMAVQKLGMGAHEARKKAQTFMASGKDNALLQRTVSENEQLKRDLAAQAQQISDLTKRIEALMSGAGGPALHPSALNGIPNSPALDIKALIQEEIRKAMQS